MEPQKKTTTEMYYDILESITWDAMHHDGQWRLLLDELDTWLEDASVDEVRRLNLLLSGSAGLLDSARKTVLFYAGQRWEDS